MNNLTKKPCCIVQGLKLDCIVESKFRFLASLKSPFKRCTLNTDMSTCLDEVIFILRNHIDCTTYDVEYA